MPFYASHSLVSLAAPTLQKWVWSVRLGKLNRSMCQVCKLWALCLCPISMTNRSYTRKHLPTGGLRGNVKVSQYRTATPRSCSHRSFVCWWVWLFWYCLYFRVDTRKTKKPALPNFVTRTSDELNCIAEKHWRLQMSQEAAEEERVRVPNSLTVKLK